MNPRYPYGYSTLAGWCTRPNYATAPRSLILADAGMPCACGLVQPSGVRPTGRVGSGRVGIGSSANSPRHAARMSPCDAYAPPPSKPRSPVRTTAVLDANLNHPLHPCTGGSPLPRTGDSLRRSAPLCRPRVGQSARTGITRIADGHRGCAPQSPEGASVFPASLASAGPTIGILIIALGVVLLIVAVLFLRYIDRDSK